MSEAVPLLELRNVTAGYAQDIDVLREIDLRVDAGRITGLIGLNGAGKSTLVKTICGFLPPKSGSVRFRGEDISGDRAAPAHRSRHLLHPAGVEPVRVPLGAAEPDAAAARATEALRRGDALEAAGGVRAFPALHAKRSNAAGSLSGGQQKQLEFAKAWLQQPALCLIDEPSIGLAPRIAEEVFVWIEKFTSAKMGILLIDHNVRRVVRMSDRVCVLSLGRITAQGDAAEFQGNLHQQVQEWLGLHF